MTQGDNFGGTLITMRYRLLGTLLGAIFSYFVYIAVGQEFSYVIGMFIPYLLLCGYIRQNRDWSYFGTVSSFTALIVTYGVDAYSPTVEQNYSLLRIQENSLGVLLVFVVSLAAVPVLALDLLRGEVLGILNLFSDSTGKLAAIYESKTELQTRDLSRSVGSYFDPECRRFEVSSVSLAHNENDDHLVSSVGRVCSQIRLKTSELPGLILNARTESLLSSIIFPDSAYDILVQKFDEMNLMMFSFSRCLFRVSNVVDISTQLHPSMESSLKYALSIRDEVLVILRRISDELLRWCSVITETFEGREAKWPWDSFLNAFSLSIDEHKLRVESVHTASSLLVINCSHFNNEMYSSWINSVLLMDRVPSDSESRASVVHKRVGALTSFNALFFAASHLAEVSINLSNTLHAIHETHRLGKHRPF